MNSKAYLFILQMIQSPSPPFYPKAEAPQLQELADLSITAKSVVKEEDPKLPKA